MSRLTRTEWLLLGALAAWAVAPLAALLALALRDGEFLTGADSLFPADQLQYLAWIRDFSSGVLAGNLFDVPPGDRVFFHPMFFLSGLAVKAGVAIQVAFLAWKPVAVGILFIGFALYVRRMLPAGPARGAALAIALFLFATTVPLLDWLGAGSEQLRSEAATIAGEMFPAGQLWGYLPTAITVGLMAIMLLLLERALGADRGRSRRTTVGLAALAGVAISWLHPWQGQTMLVILAAVFAWEAAAFRADVGPDLRRLAARLKPTAMTLAFPVAGLVIPLLYYLFLSRADEAWELARTATDVPRFAATSVAVALAPIVVPALAGVRRPSGFQERVLLVWPLAALAVYFLLSPTFPAHAFEGMSLPLAILAVRGWARIWGDVDGRVATVRTGAAALAVAALTVPGMVFVADAFRESVRSRVQPHLLEAGETDALRHLRRSEQPGGVLSSFYLGVATPAIAGRATWVGHPSWTPDFTERARAAELLFSGELPPGDARRLIAASRARFLVADCRSRADLSRLLGETVSEPRTFGCAAIYEIAD